MSIRVERSEVLPSGPPPAGGPGDGAVRLTGLLLLAGALSWGIALLSVGGGQETAIHASDMLTSTVYLAGLFALCGVVAASGASGQAKGRWFAWVPMALLPIAAVTNFGMLPHPTYEAVPMWVKIIDPSWPLSQAAMIVLSVAVIRVGRWQGALRWLPLGGALWLVVTLVAQMLTPPMVAAWVFLAWMAGTYAALGGLLVARPGAVRAPAAAR